MSRALWALTTACLVVTLGAVLYFVVATIAVRVPYWGEAEVIFEAKRLREGLPLFVDPLRGATDWGDPPSRWYVTYPPIWSWCIARVPESAALVASRVACTGAWLGALFGLALRGRADSRMNALACAAFAAGSWVMMNFASVGRPDSIAIAFAAAGLARAISKGRIDTVAVVFLVLVPWVKPTVIGLPAGAFAADLFVRRKKAVPAILLGIGLAAAIALGFHVASGGTFFANVVRSNAQPMTIAEWIDHVPSRLPFFAPLFLLAAIQGHGHRKTPGVAIGLGALGGALAWTLVALAKTGSASNYWMEPCVASVALVAFTAPTSFRFGKSGACHAAVALGATLYAGVASVRSSIGHTKDYRDEAAFVATLRERCAGGVVAADEAGIELAVSGRILTPTYQMVWLVKRGLYPARVWISDLESPRVTCVVEHTKQMRLSSELSDALDTDFAPTLERDGYTILRKR